MPSQKNKMKVDDNIFGEFADKKEVPSSTAGAIPTYFSLTKDKCLLVIFLVTSSTGVSIIKRNSRSIGSHLELSQAFQIGVKRKNRYSSRDMSMRGKYLKTLNKTRVRNIKMQKRSSNSKLGL